MTVTALVLQLLILAALGGLLVAIWRLGARRRDDARRLEAIDATHQRDLAAIRAEIRGAAESTSRTVLQIGSGQDHRLDSIRATVAEQLRDLRAESSEKLGEIRRTVDEQLQATLETRLRDTFKGVSDRLDQVHHGLGEMRALAGDVKDIRQVLSNVKLRGVTGEVLLGNLLEQVLTRSQFDINVAVKPDSAERVEFAVRLPGRDPNGVAQMWLPIDAKFPIEDYQRIVDASQAADAAAVEGAGRMLETRILACAEDIRDKYIAPPATTDFAIMFLPVEGLYAEVARRPGLIERLQRDYKVVVAGPTTMAVLLNALLMGFRTLAIEQRASEVWEILGAAKLQFSKYAASLDKLKRKLEAASSEIDTVSKRARAVERKLRNVETGAAELGVSPAIDGDAEDIDEGIGVLAQGTSATAGVA